MKNIIIYIKSIKNLYQHQHVVRELKWFHIYGINKIILFGGANVKSLNDLWECSIISPNKIDKKYLWKKIKIVEDIPSPKNGHTMKIFHGDIFIYGGLVEEIPNKIREDILV